MENAVTAEVGGAAIGAAMEGGVMAIIISTATAANVVQAGVNIAGTETKEAMDMANTAGDTTAEREDGVNVATVVVMDAGAGRVAPTTRLELYPLLLLRS